MQVLGIITLVLTAFMMIFYAYLANHTERDVSFFLSVGIISMVMNFCTNMGGVYQLSVLYLIIAVAFLALGFAVSVQDTIGFYTSIGPYFARVFTDSATVVWRVLSFVLAPVGIVLYFVFYNSDNERARVCGRAGLFGLLLWILILWAVMGMIPAAAPAEVETVAAAVLPIA